MEIDKPIHLAIGYWIGDGSGSMYRHPQPFRQVQGGRHNIVVGMAAIGRNLKLRRSTADKGSVPFHFFACGLSAFSIAVLVRPSGRIIAGKRASVNHAFASHCRW